MDEQLAEWFEKISQRTGQPVDALVAMALWDFVDSFDWDFEDATEGVIQREATSLLPAGLPAAPRPMTG